MKLVFAIFLLPLQLFAQDITGVWTGTLYSDSTRFIRYELAISEYNGDLSGYSHTIFVVDSIENVGVKSIRVRKEGEKFLLEDEKLIYNNYTAPPAKGVKMYSELSFSQNDTALVLSGSWKTNRTKQYAAINGTIFLQKKKKVQESLIMGKLENLKLTRSLSFMAREAPANESANINIPVSYSTELKKKPTGDIENVAQPATSARAGNLQSGMPVVETGLDTPDKGNQNTQLKKIQLTASDSAQLKEDKTTVFNVPKFSPKAGTVRNDKFREANKENADSVLIKETPQQVDETIKVASSFPLEKAILKKDSSNIVRITTNPTQKVNQQDSGREVTGKNFNKEAIPVDNKIIQAVASSPAGKTIPKNDSPGIVTLRITAPQKINHQKGDQDSAYRFLNKERMAADNGIIQETPHLAKGKSASQKDTSKVAATKTGSPQKAMQQIAGNVIPGKAFDNNLPASKRDTIQQATTLMAGLSIPKNEPEEVIVKAAGRPAVELQKTAKDIPAISLQKGNAGNSQSPAMPVSKAAAEITTRKIETIRSVDIKSDSLTLTLYDNGEVDGDTVSILLNGRVIMPMEGLSLKAINKTVYLTPEMGDSLVLIMYAENLGSIPPNTGLLIVHDGDDIYEIRFSGDLQKNSSIILRRKQKQ